MIAQEPGVREALVEQQRRLAKGHDMVCEGRDQGTVVFPHAECKFFITAHPRIRAERRHQELLAAGHRVSLESLQAEQEQRDERDRTRAVAPLRPADDAILVDTSELGFEAVVDLLQSHVRSRMPQTTRRDQS